MSSIEKIFVTLDTHHALHIAHAAFWVDADGNNPAPFTPISYEDAKAGKWKTAQEMYREYGIEYCKKLEANGKFTHLIWPNHCLIGTPGHNVVPTLQKALDQWSLQSKTTINYVRKGENCLTEMFSCFAAEVPHEDDPSTSMNLKLINELKKADHVLICGQALSHCVNHSVRDLASQWAKEDMHKLVILKDGASSVTSFEKDGEAFLKDMADMGATLCTTAEVEQFMGKL